MATKTILAILISIITYCSITYIECLLHDILSKNNKHQLTRFILIILISVLLGVIYLIH